MKVIDDMIEVDIVINQLMNDLEKAFNIKYIKKPIIALSKFSEYAYAGSGQYQNQKTKKFDYYLVLNDLYFLYENGKYYANTQNIELLKMRIAHELVHILSFTNGKGGIDDSHEYEMNSLNNRKIDKSKFNYNESLNEGMTQMFTDYALGKTTNSFCDGYFDFKKISQLLEYLFGKDVMIASYFNHSGLLKKGMNNYCDGLYETINKKLTFANYISASMPHLNINEKYNADLKIENDICKSLRNNIFYECLELIISNLIIPWLKNQDSETMQKEVEALLEIFNDNITLKNRIMFFLMKNYKSDISESLQKTKTDIVIENIVAMNNNVNYELLDNGFIINKSTNKTVPYNEQLYEYFYSKCVDEKYWNELEKAYSKPHLSRNTIKVSISENMPLKQRRIKMMTLKQFMRKKGYIVLNNLDCLDKGTYFEINYINERLTMSDIEYLNKNYTVVCLPGDYSNVLQIIDKKTNLVVTSDSLISKCKIAYKIATLGLSSTLNQDKWEKFTKLAENQISTTGMIKKSNEYYNNPFYSLFKEGYGCEWFYEYIKKIPVTLDVKNMDLYLSENEMNESKSLLNSKKENKKLSQLFTSFVEINYKHNKK